MGRVAAERSAETCLKLRNRLIIIVSFLFGWAGASLHAQALCVCASHRATQVVASSTRTTPWSNF